MVHVLIAAWSGELHPLSPGVIVLGAADLRWLAGCPDPVGQMTRTIGEESACAGHQNPKVFVSAKAKAILLSPDFPSRVGGPSSEDAILTATITLTLTVTDPP